MRILFALGALVALATSPAASAQEVSGSLSLQSGNPDDNGFDYTMKPTTIAEVSIDFGQGFEAGLTGYKNLEGTEGDELDGTIEYQPLKGITLTAEYYAIHASPDQIHLGVSVEQDTSIGTFDASIGKYLIDGEDGNRFQLGFSPKLGSKSFDLRVYGTHERGYDLKPITTVGAEAEWHLNGRWSLAGNLVVPVNHLDKDDPRGFVGMVGVRATF